jgi:5-(hydroxymethyl)furfural/furfural oxidase
MNFLADERDLQRLRWGFRWLVDLLASEPMRRLYGKPFAVRFTDRLRKLNQLTVANAAKARVLAGLLNINSALSDALLSALTSGDAKSVNELTHNQDLLDDHIRKNVAGTFHVCGTCRMGSSDDLDAVVDHCGRVREIGGLRVADASIMPTVPRANTNIPVLMIAEKMAELIDRSAG